MPQSSIEPATFYSEFNALLLDHGGPHMKEGIERQYEIAKETTMKERQPIPKINHDKCTGSVLSKANKAIQLILTKHRAEISLTDTNHLLCASGCAIVKSLGIKQTKKSKPRATGEKPKW